MRRPLLAVALVVVGSCGGGSPTAPAHDDTSQRPVVLNSGPYTLALTLSRTGLPTCQNGFCTSGSLCIDIGNPAASMTALFNVDLARSADEATVQVPGTGTPLVLSLRVAPASVTGSLSGSARDASGVLVDVSGSVAGAAPSNMAIAVSGNIDGQMSVSGGGCSNNGHVWSLTPR